MPPCAAKQTATIPPAADPQTFSSAPGLFIRALLALTLGFVGYWLLNFSVFPLFDPVFIWTREVSAAVGGLALVLVAAIAAWRPSAFKQQSFITSIFFGLLLGALLFMCGFYFDSIFLLLTGATLSTLAFGLVSVVVGIGCLKLSLRSAGICIAAAYLIAYALRWLFLLLPNSVGLCVYIAAPLIALLLVAPFAKPLLNEIFCSEPPAQAVVTKPASFLPLGNRVFVCLILFRFAYGYMLTFGETGRVPLLTLFALIPLTILLVVMIVEKNALNPDHLFPLAILCIVAGFLALPIGGENNHLIVNTLLSSGVGFFEVLLLFILVALGSKNRAVALVVFAWGYSLNSLGTLIGANFGRLTNLFHGSGSFETSVFTAVVILVFVAYILVALKDFSFKRTIEGITPGELRSLSEDRSQLEMRSSVVCRHYNLSSRESEVFFLLARGRTSKIIQDELSISYNTAKAHIRHVYTKLGIHTQQELIDLVDESRTHL